MAMASRSLFLPDVTISSSTGLKPFLGLRSRKDKKPRPPISRPLIVYSKSWASSRSADQCSGCVWASPAIGGVLRSPSGFFQTRPSCRPSGWHEAQAIQRADVIGDLAVPNRYLPRTHSGDLGGSHTLIVASV